MKPVFDCRDNAVTSHTCLDLLYNVMYEAAAGTGSLSVSLYILDIMSGMKERVDCVQAHCCCRLG